MASCTHQRLLTYSKQDFDSSIDVDEVLVAALFSEGGVERHHDGDVEGAEENEPVPADLEDAVVYDHQLGLLHLLHLVFRHLRA